MVLLTSGKTDQLPWIMSKVGVSPRLIKNHVNYFITIDNAHTRS